MYRSARSSANITSSKVIFEHRSAFSGSPTSVAPRYTGEQRRVNTFICPFIGGRCCNSHPVCQRKHLAKIAITSYIIARTLCISSIKEQWSRTTTTQGQMKRRRRRRTSLMLQSTAQAVPRNTTPSRIAMPRKVTGGSAPAKWQGSESAWTDKDRQNPTAHRTETRRKIQCIQIAR